MRQPAIPPPPSRTRAPGRRCGARACGRGRRDPGNRGDGVCTRRRQSIEEVRTSPAVKRRLRRQPGGARPRHPARHRRATRRQARSRRPAGLDRRRAPPRRRETAEADIAPPPAPRPAIPPAVPVPGPASRNPAARSRRRDRRCCSRGSRGSTVSAKTHQTAGSIEASGFAGITLFVALVVFVAGTVLAGRRKARTAAASRASQGAPQPRRRGRAGAWR